MHYLVCTHGCKLLAAVIGHLVSVESLPQACAQVIRAVCGLCEQMVHAELSVLLSGGLSSQAEVNEAALPVGGPGQGSDLGDAFSVR